MNTETPIIAPYRVLVLRYPCFQTFPCKHFVIFPDSKEKMMCVLEIVKNGYHKTLEPELKQHFDYYETEEFKERYNSIFESLGKTTETDAPNPKLKPEPKIEFKQKAFNPYEGMTFEDIMNSIGKDNQKKVDKSNVDKCGDNHPQRLKHIQRSLERSERRKLRIQERKEKGEENYNDVEYLPEPTFHHSVFEKPGVPLSGVPLSTDERALVLAYKSHSGQTRKFSGHPYIVHPIRVCELLRKYYPSFHSNPDIRAVALLHDVVEDTKVNLSEIKASFGDFIAERVEQLTNDGEQIRVLGKGDYLRLKLIKMSPEARAIKLCDRLDNLRDLQGLGVGKEIGDDKLKETLTMLSAFSVVRKSPEDEKIITDIMCLLPIRLE